MVKANRFKFRFIAQVHKAKHRLGSSASAQDIQNHTRKQGCAHSVVKKLIVTQRCTNKIQHGSSYCSATEENENRFKWSLKVYK